MLGGAVHAAAASPVYYQQGVTPVPVVQGQILPVDPFTGEIQRQGTGLLVSRFRNMSKFILFNGLCSANFYLLICAVYIWFAVTTPRTCNVQLSDVFLGLGLLNGLLGIIMACFLCVAQTMLSAMSHAAIADKYRLEGRDGEASTEESDYETEAKLAARVIMVPTCLYVLAMNGLIVFWTYGVFQALGADDLKCSGSGFLFWVLLLLNLLNCCVSSASGGMAYQTPTGRLV